MSEENYLELLCIFDPVLKKQDTVLRQSISSHERLTATLKNSQLKYLPKLWARLIIIIVVVVAVTIILIIIIIITIIMIIIIIIIIIITV